MVDSIDSNDELRWHIMRHMLVYFSNVFSRRLSERVKGGIARAKEKGTYAGGRPTKLGEVNHGAIKGLFAATKSLRETANRYNEGKYGANRISRNLVKKVIRG